MCVCVYIYIYIYVKIYVCNIYVCIDGSESVVWRLVQVSPAGDSSGQWGLSTTSTADWFRHTHTSTHWPPIFSTVPGIPDI